MCEQSPDSKAIRRDITGTRGVPMEGTLQRWDAFLLHVRGSWEASVARVKVGVGPRG